MSSNLERAWQEEMAEQDPKFDCPDNFQGSEDELQDFADCYDEDGVIFYCCIEERDRFPFIEGQSAVLTVIIQTNDHFNIPKYLWENYRLYKPKAREDVDHLVYPNRKYNIAYEYVCFGYFNEPGK